MCLKLRVNYGQTVGIFSFFIKQSGFKDSKSRRTAKLHERFKSNNNFIDLFSKYSKTSKIAMFGVDPDAND